MPHTVVRFELKSQVTKQFRTYNCSTEFDSQCLQNFVLAWVSRFRLSARDGYFSLHNRFQNGSGAHPASYLIGTSGSFSGGKVAGA
jgi:hypothetical protein